MRSWRLGERWPSVHPDLPTSSFFPSEGGWWTDIISRSPPPIQVRMATPAASIDTRYTLDDKYTRSEGRIYLSGVQALVRLPLMQQMRDRAAELNTAGFISGYRGSPLGGFDLELWRAKRSDERRVGNEGVGKC